LRESNLAAEGILLEDVVVMEDTSYIPNSLFCVHLQRQYSAARDLYEFLQKYNMDESSIEDENAKKYLIALKVFSE
jgi:hypothetical protein